MPILEPGTPQYDRLIEPLDLASNIPRAFALPDVTGALKAGGIEASSLYEGKDSEIPRLSSSLSNVGIDLGTAGLSVNVGMPTSNGIWSGAESLISILPEDLVADFDRAFDAVRRAGVVGEHVQHVFESMNLQDFPTQLGENLVKAFNDVLGPSMNVVSGVAQVASSFIPILGSLVRVVVALADIFRNEEEEGYVEPTTPARSFHPDVDLDFANIWVLNPMRGARTGGSSGDAKFYKSAKDLNGIFHPVGLGAKQSIRVQGTDIYRIDGTNVGSMKERKWVGMMPGSTLLDRGWDVATNGKEISGTRPLGGLLPTAADIGSKLWGMITRPGSPLMYSISPRMLRKQWATYLWGVRTEVEARTWWSDAAKAEFINNVAGPVYGWSAYPQGPGSLLGNRAKEVAHGTGTEIIDKDISYNIQNSVPVKALDNLEDLQRGALDHTVVCAYIDESFHIPDKDRWRDNRMLLLQHPDRCSVDVESIPDKDYRNAMIAAQASCGSGMILTMRPLRANAPQMVTVKQGLSSMPGASDELTGEGQSGGAGLLIAAAVLGLIALSNKKR